MRESTDRVPLRSAHQRRRNLEQRVRQLKDREDVSHLDGRQAEIAHDPGRQGRDARAIEIGDHAERCGQGHDPVAGARGEVVMRTHYMRLGSLGPSV